VTSSSRCGFICYWVKGNQLNIGDCIHDGGATFWNQLRQYFRYKLCSHFNLPFLLTDETTYDATSLSWRPVSPSVDCSEAYGAQRDYRCTGYHCAWCEQPMGYVRPDLASSLHADTPPICFGVAQRTVIRPVRAGQAVVVAAFWPLSRYGNCVLAALAATRSALHFAHPSVSAAIWS